MCGGGNRSPDSVYEWNLRVFSRSLLSLALCCKTIPKRIHKVHTGRRLPPSLQPRRSSAQLLPTTSFRCSLFCCFFTLYIFTRTPASCNCCSSIFLIFHTQNTQRKTQNNCTPPALPPAGTAQHRPPTNPIDPTDRESRARRGVRYSWRKFAQPLASFFVAGHLTCDGCCWAFDLLTLASCCCCCTAGSILSLPPYAVLAWLRMALSRLSATHYVLLVD